MNKRQALAWTTALLSGFIGFAIFCTGSETTLALNRDKTVRAAVFEFGWPYPFLVTTNRTSHTQSLPPSLHSSGWNFFGSHLQLWYIRNLLVDLVVTVLLPVIIVYMCLRMRRNVKPVFLRFGIRKLMFAIACVSIMLAIPTYACWQQYRIKRAVEKLESTEGFYVYRGPYSTASRPNDLLVRFLGKRYLPGDFWVPDSVELDFRAVRENEELIKKLTTVRNLEVVGEFPKTPETIRFFESLNHLRCLSFQDGFWDEFSDSQPKLRPADFGNLTFLDQLFGDFPDDTVDSLQKLLDNTLIETGYNLSDDETIIRVRW